MRNYFEIFFYVIRLITGILQMNWERGWHFSFLAVEGMYHNQGYTAKRCSSSDSVRGRSKESCCGHISQRLEASRKIAAEKKTIFQNVLNWVIVNNLAYVTKRSFSLNRLYASETYVRGNNPTHRLSEEQKRTISWYSA